MTAKTLKRTIVFRDDDTRQIIEGIFGDEKEINHTCLSYEMEKSVLNSILTNNRYVDNWITHLYTEEHTIGEIIQNIFYYNSASVCGKSQGLPLLKIVQFVSFLDTTSDSEIDYTKTQEILYELNNLKTYCEERYETEGESKEDYKKIISSLDFISKQFEGEKVNIRCNDFYNLVITYWEWLKDSTYTFRTLEVYVSLKKDYDMTPKLRYEFLNLLRDLAKHWDDKSEINF